MNTFISVNKLTNAVVSVKGIWRFVVGEQKTTLDFFYLHNGRIEVAPEGKYRLLDTRLSEKDCSSEAIRLNIRQLATSIPRRM